MKASEAQSHPKSDTAQRLVVSGFYCPASQSDNERASKRDPGSDTDCFLDAVDQPRVGHSDLSARAPELKYNLIPYFYPHQIQIAGFP
jgi:hypothetical protein